MHRSEHSGTFEQCRRSETTKPDPGLQPRSCARIVSVYKATHVHGGPPSRHFKVFAVRLGKCPRRTSAIPVCSSVSSDFCLCLPRSVIVSTRHRDFLSARSLKLFFN